MEENTTALNAQQEAETKQESVQTGQEVVAEQPQPDSEQGNEVETKDAPAPSEEPEKQPDTSKTEDGELDLSDKSLNEILSLFGQMIEEGDQQKLYKYAEPIKAAFYKVLRKEKIASGSFVEPGKAENQDRRFLRHHHPVADDGPG